ncbi:MAG: Imidazole glycerol phosphate synthase subunit HisH 1 [Pelotomaculum sp. PtaB.Bin104]|nr:MAG: Imidazole glycerol phosphate synthase subunit HisH 1 [Pelotomaculum sp. PtaB.Bin104]
MTVAIVNYELGNVRSVANAFEAVGARVIVTSDVHDLNSADHLVLPGVGAFEDGIKNLKRLDLVDILTELVVDKKKPFIGMCLGMQLVAQKSYENGEFAGLGWVDAEVVRFALTEQELKVPHVGWNDVVCIKDNPLFGAASGIFSYYFVHSYHMVCNDLSNVIATCDYGINFVAAIQKDNIFATQFHPEKSQKHGLLLLKNFINYG